LKHKLSETKDIWRGTVEARNLREKMSFIQPSPEGIGAEEVRVCRRKTKNLKAG
jgi:hypothetical protein